MVILIAEIRQDREVYGTASHDFANVNEGSPFNFDSSINPLSSTASSLGSAGVVGDDTGCLVYVRSHEGLIKIDFLEIQKKDNKWRRPRISPDNYFGIHHLKKASNLEIYVYKKKQSDDNPEQIGYKKL